MGIETAIIIGAVVTVGAAAASHAAQQKAAKAASRAAGRQAALEGIEVDRAIGEVEEIADVDISDRVRQANREVSTFQSGFAFGGGAGSTNELRGVIDIGYTEGADLSRIHENEDRDIASLQATGFLSAQRLEDQQDLINAQKRAATIQFLGTAASTAVGTAGSLSSTGSTGGSQGRGTGVNIQ